MKEIHKKLHHYAGISTWSSENVPQLNKVIISTCSKHELWGTSTCVLESRICNINTMLAYVMIQFMKKKKFWLICWTQHYLMIMPSCIDAALDKIVHVEAK